MSKTNVLLAGILFCLSMYLPLFADESRYSVIVDTIGFSKNLDARSRSIDTIESEFEQIKHLDILAEDVKSSGYFCYKKPSKVRWEYLKPFQYLIVINNKNVFIKDENKIERFNAGSNKIFSEINSKIMDGLKGGIIKDNNEFQSELMENSNYYLIVMKPLKKNMREFINNIKVFFEKSDFSITCIEINELSGDFTKILFRNKKLNLGLDENNFIVN